MTPLVTTIIIAIIAAAIGVVVTVVIHRSSAKNRARQIVADAERQALDIKKDKEIEGREEALKITAEAEKAANQRMSKIQSMEAKQKQRELQLNQQQGENARTRNELEAARQTLDEQYQAVERKEAELEQEKHRCAKPWNTSPVYHPKRPRRNSSNRLKMKPKPPLPPT